MRQSFCALLAVFMVIFLFSGCTGQTKQPDGGKALEDKPALVGNIPVSFPLVSSPQSLKIQITAACDKAQDGVFVWQKYREMTGVDVNWRMVTKDTRAEEVHTALTNHQQLDLILRCKLSATRLMQYGESGLILDLAKDGMLQKYAPNCWTYLQTHPDALASVMYPDGAIYSLPQVNSGPELRVGVKLFVNKLWLARVNMELPSTIDELRDLLTAFKEQDANGNGDPNDEIPLSSADWLNAQLALYGAFGLSNRGFHNTLVDSDPKTGGVRFIEGSEPYRDFLEFMHSLYADGLLDNQFFTMSADQWQANISNDKIGMFPMTNLGMVPADKLDNWVAIDEALTGPNGDKLWSAIRANFHSTGAAVLPATCSDPALVLRWLDYFWTDEGTLFYHMGVEGETYETLPDGTYDYLPKIYNEMTTKNLSFDEVVCAYTPYPGGNNPTVEIAPYFMGGEMGEIPAKAANALIQYGPAEYWPSFTFTEEENNTLEDIKADLEKYCENMRMDFVTGAISMEQWDSYKANLEKLGEAKLLKVYQAAVDRYHALQTALN